MAQVTTVTSESLQAKIRQLLPSQQGFGEDLQASNVILPIVDLTNTAEGSVLPQKLQEAINYNGATVFNISNTSFTAANTAGFWRLTANFSIRSSNSFDSIIRVLLDDGLAQKTVHGMKLDTLTNPLMTSQNFDLVFFLRSGDSLILKSENNTSFIVGSVRQIADVNGNLINPSGFTFE